MRGNIPNQQRRQYRPRSTTSRDAHRSKPRSTQAGGERGL